MKSLICNTEFYKWNRVSNDKPLSYSGVTQNSGEIEILNQSMI